MHESGKAFTISGTIADVNLVVTKERLVRAVESMMKDQGYAPSLNEDPQFTLDFDGVDKYDFVLTVYGMKVKGDAWQVSSVASGKYIASMSRSK